MHRPFAALLLCSGFAVAGCVTKTPTTATKLEPKIQAKVKQGIVEPGFTPEMVYLALGKPTKPDEGLADATVNGTWVYQTFNADERGFLRAGFRQRVVFDPKKHADIVVTEPIDPTASPALSPRSLQITFRDGRVVEIARAAL